MMNPIKWFWDNKKIKVDLNAEVIQGKSSCETSIVLVTKSSVVCKCKSLFVKNSSFFRVGDVYELVVSVKNETYKIEACLNSVNFSFKENGFLLDFSTSSDIFLALQRKH